MNFHQNGFWPGKECDHPKMAALGVISLILQGRPSTTALHLRTRVLWADDLATVGQAGYRHLGLPTPTTKAHWTGNGSTTPPKRHAYVFLLDMQKAFDKCPKDIFLSELRRFGFEAEAISSIRDIYSELQVRVKTNKTLSRRRFKPERGFPQGRPCSPIAWDILYDPVLQELCQSGLVYRVSGISCNLYLRRRYDDNL